MIETVKRSVAKAITWRIISLAVMIGIVLVVTGNILFAVGAGVIDVALKLILYIGHERIWHRITWGLKPQQGQIIWFTGPVYSGKTTVAKKLEKKLKSKGYNTVRLDGEVIYKMFPSSKSYTKAIRDKHVKRMGHISSLLAHHGVTVICTMVSPFESQRDYVRTLHNSFTLVYVTCDENEFESRISGDPELYKKIQKSLEDYEIPENPDVVIETDKSHLKDDVKKIMNLIK